MQKDWSFHSQWAGWAKGQCDDSLWLVRVAFSKGQHPEVLPQEQVGFSNDLQRKTPGNVQIVHTLAMCYAGPIAAFVLKAIYGYIWLVWVGKDQ